MGEDGNVKKFLHKQTTKTLKENGAVNDRGDVDIDTGAVIFSADMLGSLYSLISENGKISTEKYNAFVNDKVRLSLYGDFLYPLASDSTLEAFYNEAPEGELCDELLKARENPQNYGNLRVRVSGFSDYFVRLNDDIQNDILKRTTK